MSWIFDDIRFPYPNMQQLNLDWIMEKIKNLEDQINDLSGKVDPEYVDGEIGQLQEQVDTLKYFQRMYVSNSGWRVFLNADGYVTAERALSVSVTSLTARGSLYRSNSFTIPLPMPLTPANTVYGVCDRDGYVCNLDALGSGIGIEFRLCFATTTTTPFTAYVRIGILSSIRVPPATISASPNATAGAELVAIAESYVTARENGRKFEYGENFFYTNSDVINSSTGKAKMECDTFVGMCLRAIPYDKSPYVVTDPNFQYDYDDLYADMSAATAWAPSTAYAVGDKVSYSGIADFWICTEAHTSGADFDPDKWRPIWLANPNGYSWSTSLALHPADAYLGRDFKFAGDYAFKGWRVSKVFSDITRIATGDLAIWVRRIHAKTQWGYAESNDFDNVGHVGIVSIENGIPYIYHVTSGNYSDGKVVEKVTLESRDPKPTYFARLF